MTLTPATWRPQLLGKLNERHVFRVVQAHGPMSRAEVARRSGVSPPTASKAVASLMSAGLLEEVAPPGAARGRPAPLLRLAVERAQVLGVEIDAGTCRVTAAGLDGVPRSGASRTVVTPDNYAELLDALAVACAELVDRPGVTTLSVGVSLPGLIDDRLGRGVLSPNLPLTDGQRPAHDLGARLNLEAVLVHECSGAVARGAARRRRGPAGLRHPGCGRRHRPGRLRRWPTADRPHRTRRRDRAHDRRAGRRPVVRLRQHRLPGDGRRRRCVRPPGRPQARPHGHHPRGAATRR